ncbi:MAG: Asp-tRNA(Asn)/Glu-tRNA(Gln) amidotransferase subunit GatC [Candidatus Wallbacteria bacterium]
MISREEVLKISKLAMLELTDEEVSNYTRQLGGILGFFEELKELDLKNVEPANHAIITPDITREDIAKKSRCQIEVVGQSPETDGKNIIVPAIIETEE